MPQVVNTIFVKMNMDGARQCVQSFEDLKNGIKNRVIRKSVSTSVVPQNKAAKRTRRFRDRTGVLRKSLGTRVKTYRQSGVSIGLVGSRKGFAKTVIRTGGRLNPLKSYRTQLVINPRKYIHLVELGHRVRGGRYVAGRDFLKMAFLQSKQEVLSRFNSKFTAEAGREAMLAAARALKP